VRLAVIPARGGSKRIPRKNIKLFCGKPMIVWSIDAAKNSGCFERIVVSTDDHEIAEIAQTAGAEVPFIRPADLANDYASTTPVIQHATNWFTENAKSPQDKPSHVCCIYATAPFVQSTDIQDGLAQLLAHDIDYAFSATSYPFPIQRAIKITPDQRVAMFQPEHFNTRSQDLEEAFHDAGQFYWGTASAWLESKLIFSASSLPLVLPRYRVQDIDTLEDWARAERMFKAL
jgi:pseudaminic acid cytidylyltransferase